MLLILWNVLYKRNWQTDDNNGCVYLKCRFPELIFCESARLNWPVYQECACDAQYEGLSKQNLKDFYVIFKEIRKTFQKLNFTGAIGNWTEQELREKWTGLITINECSLGSLTPVFFDNCISMETRIIPLLFKLPP